MPSKRLRTIESTVKGKKGKQAVETSARSSKSHEKISVQSVRRGNGQKSDDESREAVKKKLKTDAKSSKTIVGGSDVIATSKTAKKKKTTASDTMNRSAHGYPHSSCWFRNKK